MTSLQCKWRKLKRGPPPDNELVIGDDGKVVVLWTCGCGDLVTPEGGGPICEACQHDECFHASVVPPPSQSAPQCPQPPPLAPPSQGGLDQGVNVGAGGVAPTAHPRSSDVHFQLLTSPQAPTVVSQVNAGPAAQVQCVVQGSRTRKPKAPPPTGPEPILASWHEGVQGINHSQKPLLLFVSNFLSSIAKQAALEDLKNMEACHAKRQGLQFESSFKVGLMGGCFKFEFRVAYCRGDPGRTQAETS